MPEYLPDWHEQDQSESITPTRSTPIASPSALLGAGKRNDISNFLTCPARLLRAIFIPCVKPSEAG